MVDFPRMVALAQRLISENGRTVTLVQQATVPVNVDQPWRGVGEYPRAEVSGRAAFVPADSRTGGGLGIVLDELKRSEQVVLFAAASDLGQRLEEFSLIRDDDETEWSIVKAHLLRPADERILYAFEVRR